MSGNVRSHISSLGAKLQSKATVQVADSVDTAVAALSRRPIAVFVADNALNEPSFDAVKAEVARYVQHGGRLITDLSQITSGLQPNHRAVGDLGEKRHDHVTAGSERSVDYLVK